jgi:hypothetical protein
LLIICCCFFFTFFTLLLTGSVKESLKLFLVSRGGLSLKLYASRWAKLFQENKYWEKCTKISRKVKIFKIKVIFCMFRVVKDWFCSILSSCFYCVTNAVRAVLHNYDDHFSVIFVECIYKCRLQYVNCFICSPQIILLLNTFPKFSWKLTWIWKRAALRFSVFLFLLLHTVNDYHVRAFA